MEVAIVVLAGSKVFNEHIEKYTPPDPCYETYEDVNGKIFQRRVQQSSVFTDFSFIVTIL